VAFTAFMVLNVGLNLYAGGLLNSAATATAAASTERTALNALHQSPSRTTSTDGQSGGLVDGAAAGEQQRPRDFLDLARKLACSRRGVRLIEVAWYANLLLILGQYLLVMTRGLDLVVGRVSAFGLDATCAPLSSGIAAVFAFCLAQCNRTMLALDHGPSQVSVVAVAVILVLCVAALHREATRQADDDSTEERGGFGIWADGDAESFEKWARDVAHRLHHWARPHHKSAKELGAACASIVFAVNSQKLLLNVRAEMANTRRANCALALALLFYVAIYFVVVLAAGPKPPDFLLDVFWSDGDPQNDKTRTAPNARIVGALLFAHVAVSYAINQQALAATVCAAMVRRRQQHVEYDHHLLAADDDDDAEAAGVVGGAHRPRGAAARNDDNARAPPGVGVVVATKEEDPRPRLRWALVTFALTCSAWLVANAVPFFADLVSLIGALTSAPLSFAVPPLLYRLAHPRAHTLGTGLLLLFTAVVLVTGTAGSIANIVSHWEELKQPFHC